MAQKNVYSESASKIDFVRSMTSRFKLGLADAACEYYWRLDEHAANLKLEVRR